MLIVIITFNNILHLIYYKPEIALHQKYNNIFFNTFITLFFNTLKINIIEFIFSSRFCVYYVSFLNRYTGSTSPKTPVLAKNTRSKTGKKKKKRKENKQIPKKPAITARPGLISGK